MGNKIKFFSYKNGLKFSANYNYRQKTKRVVLANFLKNKKLSFYETDNNYTLIQKYKNNKSDLLFVKIFNKHGKQVKFWSIFAKSINNFYYYYYHFNKTAALYNKNYLTIINFFYYNEFFYITNVIDWINTLLEPIFNYVVKKVEKKFKKKLKKKFTASCIYIQPNKRKNIVIRNLINFSNLFNNYNLETRLGKSFFRTCVEYKSSHLYLKKITLYNEILKNQKMTTHK